MFASWGALALDRLPALSESFSGMTWASTGTGPDSAGRPMRGIVSSPIFARVAFSASIIARLPMITVLVKNSCGFVTGSVSFRLATLASSCFTSFSVGRFTQLAGSS
jgi:hypothetical protein